ncbi:MAG TPA: isoprenylcysteine carboxylmethyltransferase family protein [Polyangia bacterium]|jgi:methyltransferase|nr:isoprenylcysteine carboxylmethyltransferase family protein [Polyangia bacterium]
MELTALYIGLLAAVGLGRLVEMRLSRRHQRWLRALGVTPAREPGFVFMVALHTGVLVAAAAEVTFLRRPLLAPLAVPALVLFLLSNVLRWWVIAAMGQHWNVQVMGSMRLGVVSRGPFRWIRHPNYVAVFVELLALPLIHTAWLTAALGTCLHVLVLRRRIALEESVLMSDPDYRAVMGPKPRFVPRPWSRPPKAQAWPMS